jgi:periplasmic mercuric ion binding protein
MKKFLMVLFLISSNVFAGEISIKVQGMVCSMCAQGIKKKFSAIKEVKAIDVNLDQKFVTITTEEGKNVADEQIKTIITEAGYNVASIERK